MIGLHETRYFTWFHCPVDILLARMHGTKASCHGECSLANINNLYQNDKENIWWEATSRLAPINRCHSMANMQVEPPRVSLGAFSCFVRHVVDQKMSGLLQIVYLDALESLPTLLLHCSCLLSF